MTGRTGGRKWDVSLILLATMDGSQSYVYVYVLCICMYAKAKG
jgi:hypothetical protein